MSLDVAQNASAVTELIFAGLKVTGYGVVMICSVLGSHTIESHWNTEKRMAETVAHWRNVLSHLDEKKKDEIGRENIRCMDSRLYQYVPVAHQAQLIETYELTLATGWRDA
ncbi:hypothetical protein TRAPUB_14142 [Trametes pubescens]|uniref:Uncharacterized protein n=1 Tax=Trametes pubescens TaxID=154538 RepID=A0A1M2VP94_TRAPU|nr:hypothetical protein TRAPUB_14142 [Trametes pubescens]